MPLEKRFNKQEALGQALEAFWSRGFEATSMQDLVDCMGINRGSLYATFGDKRALFLAALASYDERRRHMLAGFEKRYEPRDAIRQVFLAFTRDVSEAGGNKGCFITNTALELAAHDREIRKLVATAQANVEDFFVRMIRKGKSAGDIPQHVRPAETARGLLASLLGLLVLTRSRPEGTLLKAIVDEAMRRLD
ncbi:MAG: TetR/AcrR family transcriptional regulator [Hyphomicrobiaceae bacterium]|nr:TetR/AcrR family transcriptional regulator [Hyphomicrobiaceae bacterium]